MKRETLATHSQSIILAQHNKPLASPIHRASKFSLPSLEAVEEAFKSRDCAFFYSRMSNPTVRELEQTLAKLQQKEDAICLGSGVAAITGTLLHLLSSGDCVLYGLEGYKPTRTFSREFLKKFGVRSAMVSVRDLTAIEAVMKSERPRCFIFESPTNPTCAIADLDAVCALAREYNVITILDNTFAGVHAHASYPIDIYLHSLSKFVGGHSDVIAGAVIASQKIIDRMRPDLCTFGATMDPETAYLCLRGLKTYFLRFQKQSQNALEVSNYLSSHPKIEFVSYPGLASHPSHELATEQMEHFGSVLYARLKGGKEMLHSFVSGLSLISLTASLGSTETVIAPALMFYGDDLSQQECEQAGICDGAFRLSVGIEAVEDIIADIEASLSQN